MKPKRILVVRLSAMGDIIHTLPAVAALKRSFPDARITWAVKPRWLPLLRGNPHLYSAWIKPWVLPFTRFDLAIDFQGLTKSGLLAWMACPGRVLGFDWDLLREKAAGLFYARRIHSDAEHVVDCNLDLAVAAGARRRSIEFHIPDYPPEGSLPKGDFILANPFAGWKAKEWPPEHYAELARLFRMRYKWPVVLNCSPSERQRAEAIPDCRVNCTSVEGLIGATRRARGVVGVDSGPMHLAAALGKPGVALFGPTDPARNGPYGDSFTVLRAPEAVTSYRRQRTISPSMRALDPDEVMVALEKQIVRRLQESKR